MASTSSTDTSTQAPPPATGGPAPGDAAEQPVPVDREAALAPCEVGGRKDGTEPTRYGDWEKHGRCIDF